MYSILHNNNKISYQTFNNEKDKSLVFLHGFCEDMTMWMEYFTSFSSFKIILIDLPGFGLSSTIPSITLKKMAFYIALVLETEKISTTTIIGHSMGGYIGLELIKNHSSQIKFKGICLFHSHIFGDTKENQKKRIKRNLFIEKNGHHKFIELLIPKFFHPDFYKDNDAIIQNLIHQAKKLTPAGIIYAQTAMKNRQDFREWAKLSQIPFMFIIGTDDTLIDPIKNMEQISIPPISFTSYQQNIGHMGMFEHKKETIKDLKEFLAYIYR